MEWWLVKELTNNWSALAAQTAMSVVAPKRSRLRRTMVLGEAARCDLPWTRVDSIICKDLPDTASLQLRSICADHHSCSFHELATLAILAKWIQPTKALEIGTYDGRSALAIATNMPEQGRLWTLNLPPDYTPAEPGKPVGPDEAIAFKVESGYRFKPFPESSRITQIFGDSTKYDWSEIRSAHGGGPFQYIFIDGGHSSEIVLSDSRHAFDLVDKNNGLVLWHDTTRFGVRPALEQLRSQGHPISLILGTTIGVLRYKEGKAVDLPY